MISPIESVVYGERPPTPEANRSGPGNETKPVEAEAPRSKPTRKVVVKRRSKRTEEDLLRQVTNAPTLALDRTAAGAESVEAVVMAERELKAGRESRDTTLALLDRRTDLGSLPLRRGEACRLSPSAAACLEEGSVALRGKTHDPAALREVLAGAGRMRDEWSRGDTVPVLVQMLMAEAVAVREVLTEQLSRVEGKPATEALARLALFDLNPRIRERAITALTTRTSEDYQPALLAGFEHPWPVVADHAAEALVALGQASAVPALVSRLERLDPRAAIQKAGSEASFVKEMVRVNHLQNCLLCHPPSFEASDKVRAGVPSSEGTGGQAPSSRGTGGYSVGSRGIFVRADVTYLKQDFSVMLPVFESGSRRHAERFDFFVRERVALPSEVFEGRMRKEVVPEPSKQQKSAIFALRELTGQNLGPRVSDWTGRR